MASAGMPWLFLVGMAACAATSQPRRVLILDSFGREFAPWSYSTPALKTELARESSAPIEFHEVSLETARFGDAPAEVAFTNYLRALYPRRGPDLVVPVGGAAAQFWGRHRHALFPSSPVLIGWVNQQVLPSITLTSNDTAVLVEFDMPALVEVILQVLPATTNIAVAIGNSPIEQFWVARCRQAWQPFTNRVHFTWFNKLSLEEMCRRAAALPPRSAIGYGMVVVDAAGVSYEQSRALDRLGTAANAPVFGLYEEQLGHRILGGRLSSGEALGRATARIAGQMLRGQRPDRIQQQVIGTGPPIFDWRELRRWQIDESRLPPGSLVRFRPTSAWERYRWYILGSSAIMLAQAATIAGVLLQRARRRRAEASAYTVSGRLITAQEEERRRVARDLHDDLNQRLALLSVELDLAGHAGAQPGLAAMLGDMADQVKDLSSEVHKLSYQLHPAKLDQLGLVTAARTFCSEFSAQSGLRIAFTHHNVARDLPAEVALCVYRVLQEALGNIVRHSRATEVQADLRVTDHHLHLAVSDNGTGFDLVRARRDGGLGLLSMEERARLAHGRLTIRAAPGHGTRIELSIPVPPTAPRDAA